MKRKRIRGWRMEERKQNRRLRRWMDRLGWDDEKLKEDKHCLCTFSHAWGKMCPPSKCSPGRHLKPWCVGGWQPWLFPWGECPCCTSCSLSPSPTKTRFSAGWMEAGRWRTPSSLLWTRSHLDQKRIADDHGWHYVMFFSFSLCVVCVWWTFAVLPVEEWHVKYGGLLLFPLENIAGPWPVFLLQEFLL